jgi:hypothetical protein
LNNTDEPSTIDVQSRVSLHAEHPEWAGAGPGSADQLGLKGAALERADIAAALRRLEEALAAGIRYNGVSTPNQTQAEGNLHGHCLSENRPGIILAGHLITESAQSNEPHLQSNGQVVKGYIGKHCDDDKLEDGPRRTRSSSRRAKSRSCSAENGGSRKQSAEREKRVEIRKTMLANCRAAVEKCDQQRAVQFVHHLDAQFPRPREKRTKSSGDTPEQHQQVVECDKQVSKHKRIGTEITGQQQLVVSPGGEITRQLYFDNGHESYAPVKGRFLVTLPTHTLLLSVLFSLFPCHNHYPTIFTPPHPPFGSTSYLRVLLLDCISGEFSTLLPSGSSHRSYIMRA